MTWLPLLVQLGAAALLIVLSTYVCVRPPPRLMWPDLLILLLAELSFVVGDAMTFHASSMRTLEVGLAFLYVGAITGPAWLFRVGAAMLLLRKPELQWPHVARKAVAIGAALACSIALTNPLHQSFLIPVLEGRNQYQPLWWIVSAAGWTLMLGAASVFGYQFWLTRSKQYGRLIWSFHGGWQCLAASGREPARDVGDLPHPRVRHLARELSRSTGSRPRCHLDLQ